MNTTWVHYEICMEDEDGLAPFDYHYDTKAEAEAELRKYLPQYPTLFIITVVKTRCGERMPHPSIHMV